MRHEGNCCWHPYPANPLTAFGLTGQFCCIEGCKNAMIDQPGVVREIKTHGAHGPSGMAPVEEQPKLGVGVRAPRKIWTPEDDQPKAAEVRQ